MTRDIEVIDSELTLLAAVRTAMSEMDVRVGVRQLDELLDERSQVADARCAVKHPAR